MEVNYQSISEITLEPANSMFSFTSIGGEVDNSVNTENGPYVYRVNVVNHHRIGTLLHIEGRIPKFLQLYMYDTDHEISNKLRVMSSGNWQNDLEQLIVDRLLQMWDAHNPLNDLHRVHAGQQTVYESV
ncbi:hypothetical protein COLO4_28729 [Corchorus olitorius]|uniref:Uncharacterized protein n=1 Tax=Corchorus olitorius TaxID=93759 RepID=A0A1R3HIN7_9ROSI|nr:hypothetical protein COLO4_28729 [Corchorus olitorius]